MPRSKARPTTPTKQTPRQREVLRELCAEWDRKLAVLNEPGAHERMDQALASHGRVLPRPKAGSSF